jgi:hypothetical protein
MCGHVSLLRPNTVDRFRSRVAEPARIGWYEQAMRLQDERMSLPSVPMFESAGRESVAGPPVGQPAQSTVRAAKAGVLTGEAYVHRTRTAPTVDGDADGRWIAADESGWNGEALLQPGEPYVSVGSVAVDDIDAPEIVAELRRVAGIHQAGELKFGHFAGRRGAVNVRRLEVLADALSAGGPLADRASVFLVDARYFVTSKIIDLLLEEFVHDHGGNLHAGDGARMAAWTLFDVGPRALGVQLFNELIGRFTEFAGLRNRHQAQVTVAELFHILDRAERASTRRKVTDLLRDLRRCREQADELQRHLTSPTFPATMEPLTPSIPAVFCDWADRLGPVSMLLDAHKVWTDDHLDITWKVTKTGRGLPHPMFGYGSGHLRGMVRGRICGPRVDPAGRLGRRRWPRRCALPPRTGGQRSKGRRVPCTGRGAAHHGGWTLRPR